MFEKVNRSNWKKGRLTFKCALCHQDRIEGEFSPTELKKGMRCRECLSDTYYHRNYGLSKLQYLELLDSLGGQCEICKRGLRDIPLRDVSIYKKKALLCRYCAIMLGHANYSIECLQRAITFLDKYENIC